MKNLILLLMIVFMTSGCSVLKSVVAPLTPVKTTLPQSTEKSKAKYKCKGKLVLNEKGEILSCSKGYSAYEQRFNQKERKLKWKEKLAQFITRASGYFIIGIGLLIFFAPGLLGLIVGRVLESTVGITGQALKSTVRAIKKAKRNGGKFMEELDREHNKNKAVQKKINKLRAEE